MSRLLETRNGITF